MASSSLKPLPLAVAMATSALISPAFALSPCTPGTTYTVTSAAGDTSDGTLRAAIALANGNAGCDQIEFADGISSIELGGITAITESLNIIGPGAESLSISLAGGPALSGLDDFQDLYVSGVTIENSGTGINVSTGIYTDLTVENSVIRNNSNTAIFTAQNQSVTLNNVSISGHSNGRAVYLDTTASTGTNAVLAISNSTFTNNTNAGNDSGGALYMTVGRNANVNITGSQFINNGSDTTASGGAVMLNMEDTGLGTVSARIEDSTFSANRAVNGGALAVSRSGIGTGGTLSLVARQNTFAGNIAGGTGGAIDIPSSGTSNFNVDIESSSIIGNSADEGGGISGAQFTTVNVRNSVIARNNASTRMDNIGYYTTAINYSWIGDNGDMTFVITSGPGTGNTFDGDESTLNIGPLRDNGGDTLTIALGASSPLVDAGDPSAIQGDAVTQIKAEDQRGGTRVVNARLDIGAFEFNAATDPDVPATDGLSNAEIFAILDALDDDDGGSPGWLALLLASALCVRRRR